MISPSLINAYLREHPKCRKLHAWKYMAQAAELAESSPKWRDFFARDFETPQELLKASGAILVRDCDNSSSPLGEFKEQAVPLSRLLHYYILLYPEKGKSRLWSNAIAAANLAAKSQDWADFFQKEYADALELFAAVPPDSPYSLNTLGHYYFIFHPAEKSSMRWRWLNAASALELRESSAKWRVFFDTEYESPFELLRAVPPDAGQTPQTLVNYYTALRPQNMQIYQEWNRVVSSWNLYQQQPQMFRELCSGALSYKAAILKYQITLSASALCQHVYRLRKYKVINF